MTEKIRDYLGIVLIIVLLVFAYVAVVYVMAYSESTEPSSFKSFAVTGQGESVAIPDVAVFSFSVITEGSKQIASLQEENTNKVNKAIEFVKSNDIDDIDIKTQQYSLQPRYQYYDCRASGVCPPAEIVGYTVTQSVQVKIRDFTKIGGLVSGVVDNGANQVSDLRFTIDDPTSVEDQARAEAITKAQAKAKSVAKAAGFRLGDLLSIDEGGAVPIYDLGKGGFGGAELSLAPVIEPGSQEVTVNVTLRYEIK
ncbi:MAG: SIMPL domain-containing protein [Patescibacteria group bacterium]